MTHQPVLRRRHRLLTPTVLSKPIPDTDLIAFFQVIDSVRDRLIFLLMLRCGLRVSEVCALPWDAIDRSAGTVRITRGKGQVDRIVYLSPDVTQALQVWWHHHMPGRYLFPSRTRTKDHLSRSQINVLMEQYLGAAGLTRHYSPHCLRHTFATQLLNAGVPLEVLKELMGHHSIQITLRYTQLYDATKRHQYEQAMTKITWLFRYVISANRHANFQIIPYESTSHSMGYEHAPHIVGEEGHVHWRCVTPTPLAAPSPPGSQRCQSPR